MCQCGICEKGSSYRDASASLSKLRAYVHAPCGKTKFPSLRIANGKFSSEEAPEFYRRQCCRAPLPAEVCPHQAAGTKRACAECGDCSKCGWALTMGKASCPIEGGDAAEAAMAKADAAAASAKAEAEAAAGELQRLSHAKKAVREEAQAKAEAAAQVATAADSNVKKR